MGYGSARERNLGTWGSGSLTYRRSAWSERCWMHCTQRSYSLLPKAGTLSRSVFQSQNLPRSLEAHPMLLRIIVQCDTNMIPYDTLPYILNNATTMLLYCLEQVHWDSDDVSPWSHWVSVLRVTSSFNPRFPHFTPATAVAGRVRAPHRYKVAYKPVLPECFSTNGKSMDHNDHDISFIPYLISI